MTEDAKNTIRQLSRIQRRVLGTLVEKRIHHSRAVPVDPEVRDDRVQSKSNRDPVTEYSEAEVADALEQLREMGLVAEVFSDGGRAARYRHYIRHCFDFSEPQIAVIAELMLRGRQQPGELRTRASRMVRIDSQDQLKSELQSLQEKGYLQSDGAADRRGVEVDHTLYTDSERRMASRAPAPAASTPSPPSADPDNSSDADTFAGRTAVIESSAAINESAAALRAAIDQIQDLTDQVSRLTEQLQNVAERMDRLERDLGV